jgi:predicted O-linked N-acetylglucosamine transferase (SPINDLY family)
LEIHHHLSNLYGIYCVYTATATTTATQMLWWGHPTTTGMPDGALLSMDYFLSLDAEVKQAGDQHYSEQLVRMEYVNTAPFKKVGMQQICRHCNIYLYIYSFILGFLPSSHCPFTPATATTPLQSGSVTAAERLEVLAALRMPAAAPYCLVVGRLFKLHPEFDSALGEVLRRNPQAFVVFIFERALAWNRVAMQRLAGAVGPAGMARVRLGAFSKYSALVRHADVILDTFPYGGMKALLLLTLSLPCFMMGCVPC